MGLRWSRNGQGATATVADPLRVGSANVVIRCSGLCNGRAIVAEARPSAPIIACDACDLRILVGGTIDQPIFHVFDDGVLCDDCYRGTLDGRTPPLTRDDA